MLQRGGEPVALSTWAQQVLDECVPFAAALDAAHGTIAYSEAVALAAQRVAQPQTTPSAQVLERMRRLHGDSFEQFGLTQSLWVREQLLSLPWTDEQQAKFAQMAAQSEQDQQAIEAADTGTFEEWRLRYMDPAALG